MLEIIATQIKEMEDAGWVYRGKSATACPLHVVRKPTAPGEKHNECDIEIERGGRYGLHPRSRVHPVFHVSKVKAFNGDPAQVKTEHFGADTGDNRWVVEAILDHRGERADGRQKSTLEYFVKWQGFNVEDYTWEKERDVVGTAGRRNQY